MKIIPLCPDHWADVQRIYEEGVATGRATFSLWTSDWEAWDKNHLKHSRLVAIQENGLVLGWIALMPVSIRPVYSGVAELSIYIGEGLRGKGVGRALMDALIQSSEQNGVWTLQAAILTENEPSIMLHTKLGFRLVGYREKIAQLKGKWRDSVLMERRSKKVGV